MKGIKWIVVLGVSPLLVTGIIFFEFYNSGLPLKKFIEGESIFLVSALLIYLQFLLMILYDFFENKETLSGKWHTEFKAINWRGDTEPNVLGVGSIFLSKQNFNSSGYSGNMFLAFFDKNKEIIHKGIFHVNSSRRFIVILWIIVINISLQNHKVLIVLF